MSSVVRAAEGQDDRDALERVLKESFGADELPWAAWMERIGHANLRVVEDGGVVRGGLGFYRFGQFWGGTSVAEIGIAGVGIAPDVRGRGLARQLLVATLAGARAEGIPLAGLYASSVAVYRSIGFEQASSAIRYAAPITSLAHGDRSLACEPFDPSTDRSLRPLYAARAQQCNGHLDRNEALWDRIAKPAKGVVRGYRFGPATAPEGYVVYLHAPTEGLHFDVGLRDFVLATPAAARRAMALLSDLRSLGGDLRWLGCGSDSLLSLLPEQTARVVEHGRSMLRILDVERALVARGWTTDGEARFDVRDALFGDLGIHLRVRDGRADVKREPPGKAALVLDVRALAAMYTSFTAPTTLATMGLLEGDLAEAARLARLFAGPEPWVCDWY